MSTSKQAGQASERVREAYRRMVTSFQTRLSPETFSDLADLEIADAYLADPNTGLVYSRYIKDDDVPFGVNVPGWFFTDRDTLRIEHSRDGTVWTVLHEEVVTYYDNPIPLPYPVELDKSKDQLQLEGTHYLRSWIRNDVNDVSWSLPLVLIFDREPPYHHANPNNPREFAAIPAVTDASLAANNDTASLTLPAYPDWQDGDEVLVYWMSRPPEEFDDVDPPVFRGRTTGANQTLAIPGDEIRRVGDGGVIVLYVLLDKAGNVSALSIYRSVAVALGVIPIDFDEPVVPLATDQDGHLIDQADAYEGVEVWVPSYVGMKASDRVQVKWGDTALVAETVGSAPNDYIRVLVPNDVMLKEYGTGPGRKPTNVSYVLLRGTHPMGGANTDIFVDFETMDPDGPDIGWPGPIHPDLPKALITGRGSLMEDELDVRDNGLPADLSFELYSFAEADDELTFFWAGEEAATYKVKAADNPGDKLVVEVPWAIIHEGGNSPALPVDYEARRPGVHNPVRSAVTSVVVDAITITPIAAAYDHLVNGMVTCASIQASSRHPDGPAVEVLIPDLTEYLQHDSFTEIDVKWFVYRGRSDEQGFNIIDAVTLEETIELNDQHPVTGFTWRVPFETNVLPTNEGSPDPNFWRSRANMTYTLKMAKGDVLSEVAKVTLAFIPPSGVCNPDG